jgi:hypothetical protein
MQIVLLNRYLYEILSGRFTQHLIQLGITKQTLLSGWGNIALTNKYVFPFKTFFSCSLFLQFSEIDIFKISKPSSSLFIHFSLYKKTKDKSMLDTKTKHVSEKSTNLKKDQKWSRQSKRRKRSESSHFSDQQGSSGFHPLSQIEFLSSFNFSDPLEFVDRTNSEDPTPIVPVTEMSDLELKRLGFPVPTTTTESIYSILHGFSGPGSHDLSSVIDSPYIKFTSRK